MDKQDLKEAESLLDRAMEQAEDIENIGAYFAIEAIVDVLRMLLEEKKAKP